MQFIRFVLDWLPQIRVAVVVVNLPCVYLFHSPGGIEKLIEKSLSGAVVARYSYRAY